MPMSTKKIEIGLALEELRVGDCFVTRRRTISDADLAQFVNLTWMVEELFTATPEAPQALPPRVVPGALIYSFAEGLVLPSIYGSGLAFLGTELTCHAPASVGDTIRVEFEVIENRPTKSPGRGFVRTLNKVMKDSGEVVLTYNPARLIRTAASMGKDDSHA
jgi:acyl dehydratase